MTYENIGIKKRVVPKYITKPKKIETAIKRAKIWLKKLVKKYGIYENFGDGVYRELNDKYIDISSYSNEMDNRRTKLDRFSEWCGYYQG